MNYDDIIIENAQRIKTYFRAYDPVYGDEMEMVIPRKKFSLGEFECLLPITMWNVFPELGNVEALGLNDKLIDDFLTGLMKVRCEYDFEFWCYTCVNIEDKTSKRMIPFVLNYGQRLTAQCFEQQRIAGEPIRTIICKARQWGGSTVTQMYMLWLQLYHYSQWHSAIISQLKSQSANIRDMITRVINSYPEDAMRISIGTFEGSPLVKYIPQRKTKIFISSAETPEALRSFDFSMLHMSEVGLWKSTLNKSADDLAQSIYSTVPDVAGTFICMESTAKGIGNFFHKNYLDAKNGNSIMKPIFVAWFHNVNNAEFKMDATGQSVLRDQYGLPVSAISDDYPKIIQHLNEYQKAQWRQGATLEGIVWYKKYKKGHQFNDFQMKSEYPGTDLEAFQTKSNSFFEEKHILWARYNCRESLLQCDIRGDSLTGESAMRNITLDKDGYGPQSGFDIWIEPTPIVEGEPFITNQFLVVVDIGGVYATSDWGVISVFDRSTITDPNGALERAATWRGHIAPDLLAWKAVQIAKYYNNALLVIESNTLDTRFRKEEQTYEGNHFYTVIDEISDYYSNLYMRESTPDKVTGAVTTKFGWHTNARTKALAYDTLRQQLRDAEYIERDNRAVDEMANLEIKPDGSLGAIQGEHDDIIDTAAIGAYISAQQMDKPREVNFKTKTSISATKVGGGSFASF